MRFTKEVKLKPPSKRKEIVDWYVNTRSGGMDYIFIPEGHSNAFVGVIAGTKNPTIAILDYDIVVTNMINQGYSEDEAEDFANRKSEKPSNYGPYLVHQYPELHPNF